MMTYNTSIGWCGENILVTCRLLARRDSEVHATQRDRLSPGASFHPASPACPASGKGSSRTEDTGYSFAISTSAHSLRWRGAGRPPLVRYACFEQVHHVMHSHSTSGTGRGCTTRGREGVVLESSASASSPRMGCLGFRRRTRSGGWDAGASPASVSLDPGCFDFVRLRAAAGVDSSSLSVNAALDSLREITVFVTFLFRDGRRGAGATSGSEAVIAGTASLLSAFLRVADLIRRRAL